jgi:hypothetical protein
LACAVKAGRGWALKPNYCWREIFDSLKKPASTEELAAVPNVTAMTGNKQTRIKLSAKLKGGISFTASVGCAAFTVIAGFIPEKLPKQGERASRSAPAPFGQNQ